MPTKYNLLKALKTIRVRVFLITLLLVSLPQLFAAYLFLNQAEESLFRERASKLTGIATLLEKEFQRRAPIIFAELSIQQVPADQKRDFLEKYLNEPVNFLQSSYPEVGLGYFMIDYGGEVSVLRPAISPQEIPYSVEVPLVYMGKNLGHAFAEESLRSILKDLSQIRQSVFLILTISLLLGIAGAYLLSANLGQGVKVIKEGLSEMEKSLKARVMPLQGEMGEIEEAINHLADSLEEALARLNLVFESSPVGLLLITADENGEYHILLHNQPFLQLLNISVESVNQIFSMEQFFSPEVVRSLKKNEKTEFLNIPLGERYFNLLVVGLGGEGALLLLEEVTERNKLLEELKRKEKIASLGLLIASLAHEIKNPLTSIKGYAELLLKQPLKDKERIYLTHILKESERVNSLIGELLYLGRPVTLKKDTINLKGLVEEALTAYKPMLEKEAIIVEMMVGNDTFVADKEKMLRALTNLIKNSLEALHRGGTLYLKGKVAEGTLLLEVKDTGRGMPKEVAESIFDPFYSTKEKGVGLGLSVAHSIVKAHGGSLSVASKEGEGTSFTLIIPA